MKDIGISSDEGYIFDYEDSILYTIYKIKNLIKEGKSPKEIVEFENADAWLYFSKKVLDSYFDIK